MMRAPKQFVLLGSLPLIVSLLLAFTLSASPAFAATSRSAQVSTVHFTLATSPTSASAAGPGGEIISCTETLIGPGLFSGDLDVGGIVTCTAAVSAISINLELYRADGGVDKLAKGVGAETTKANASIVYKCPSPRHYHNWQAYMSGGIVFPAGFVPQSSTFFLASPIVREDC